MRNLRRNEIKDTERKKNRHLIRFNIHKDGKSLNIISTEGGFYFLSRLNKLFLKFVIDEFLYCIADSPLHIALH